MALTVVVKEVKFPRKDSQYSVWVKEGDKSVFCAHPLTDREQAEIVADAFRVYLTARPEEAEKRIKEYGY